MSCEIIRPAAFARRNPDDPENPPPASAAAHPGFRRREYSIFEIARLLGIYERTDRFGRVRHSTDRTIIRHIRDQIDLRKFPAPLGIRIRRGRAGASHSTILEGADAVDMRARWCAIEVEAWHHDQLTPAARAIHDRAAYNHAAAALDAQALNLYGDRRRAGGVA